MTTFTHSSGQHLSVDDAEIYFEIIGNPIGSPLLLLHGGLGNLTDFNGMVAQLASEFRLIGINFRGHGKSTLGKSRLTYQRYQADVEAILAHLNIDCFSILGFSDGGITALRMAAETPARIKGLVAVAAQSQMEADDPILPMLSGVTADVWETKFPDAVCYYRENNPEPDFDALIKSVVSPWKNIKQRLPWQSDQADHGALAAPDGSGCGFLVNNCFAKGLRVPRFRSAILHTE